MFKWTAILLTMCMTLLASGIVRSVHERSHLHPHALAAEGMAASAVDQVDGEGGVCQICLQLQVPLMLAAMVALLVDSGERVFSVGITPLSQKSQGAVERISCRGPPAESFCTL
jgi:hypothetical protein